MGMTIFIIITGLLLTLVFSIILSSFVFQFMMKLTGKNKTLTDLAYIGIIAFNAFVFLGLFLRWLKFFNILGGS